MYDLHDIDLELNLQKRTIKNILMLKCACCRM